MPASSPQIRRVFENLHAVAQAAGGGLGDIVKLTVYLTDLANFARLNEIMATCFTEPYPARAAVGVASLPRGALVEVDADHASLNENVMGCIGQGVEAASDGVRHRARGVRRSAAQTRHRRQAKRPPHPSPLTPRCQGCRRHR